MARYVTDPLTRKQLAEKGIDPDGLGVGDILYDRGYGAYLGEQPSSGIAGSIEALGQSAAKGVANAALGIADLPGATETFIRGKGAAPVLPRFNPMQPSPTERANPISSGVGSLVGFIAPLVLTEGLAAGARAGTFASKLARTANASGLAEKAMMAERGVKTLEAAAEVGAKSSLLAGLGPKAIALRATRGAIRGGTLGFTTTSGSIEDRVKAGAETAAFFAGAEGLGAPAGAPRLVRLVREAASGAGQTLISPPPVDIPGVPSAVTGALTGGILSQLGGGYQGPKAKAIPRAAPAPEANAPAVESIRTYGTVDDLALGLLRRPAEAARSQLSDLMTNVATLPPEAQSQLRSILGELPDSAYPPVEARSPNAASTKPAPARATSTDLSSDAPIWSMHEADAVEAIRPDWRKAEAPDVAYAESARAYYDQVVEAQRVGHRVPTEVQSQPGYGNALSRAKLERRNLAGRPAQDVWEAAQQPIVTDLAAREVAAHGAGEPTPDFIQSIRDSLTGSYLGTVNDPAKARAVAKLALSRATPSVFDTQKVAVPQQQVGLPGAAPSIYDTQPVRIPVPDTQEYAAAIGPQRTTELTNGSSGPITEAEYGLVLAHAEDSYAAPIMRSGTIVRDANTGELQIVATNGHLEVRTLRQLGDGQPTGSAIPAPDSPVRAAARDIVDGRGPAEERAVFSAAPSTQSLTQALVARGFAPEAAAEAARAADLRPRKVTNLAQAADATVDAEAAKTRRTKARPREIRTKPEPRSAPVPKTERAAAAEKRKTQTALRKVVSRATTRTRADERMLASTIKSIKTIVADVNDLRGEVSVKGVTEAKRRSASARIGTLSDRLSKFQAQAAAVSQAVAQRRANLDPVQSSPEAMVLMSRLGAIDQTIANEAAVLQDRTTGPAAAETVSLTTAREAVAMVGTSGMSKAHFSALPPSLQVVHLVDRLMAHRNVNSRGEQKARYVWLDRFFKADPKREAAYPITNQIRKGGSSAGATYTIQAELERQGLGGVTVRHEEYGTGNRQDRWVVEDGYAGTAYAFETPEAAALGVDILNRQRGEAPDLTPPGVKSIVDLPPGGGPTHPPTREILEPGAPPPGGIDGERGAGGVPRVRPAGPIEISRTRRLAFVPIRTFAEIDRLFTRATGSDLGLTRLFRTALPAYVHAAKESRVRLGELAELASKHGVHDNDATGRKLAAAARFVDDAIYPIQRAGGMDAAQAALPRVIAKAAASHQLTTPEARFLFGDESAPAGTLERGGAQAWFTSLYQDLGVSADQVVGYFPRSRQFVKALATRGRFLDPLDWNVKDWARELARQRGEASDLIDPQYQALLDEFGVAGSGEHFFRTAETYARQGYRVKNLGLHVEELTAAVKQITDKSGQSALGPNATEFIRNAISSLVSQPSQSDVLGGGSRARGRIETARKLMRLHDKIADANPMIEPLAGALKSVYQRLAVSGLEGRERGLASLFLRAHRASIFALSPMRAMRDAVTTDLFFLYPRFEHSTFARGTADVLSPTQHADLVTRYRDLGFLDMDDYIRFEEGRTFSKFSQNANEIMSWMYRRNDTHTRMMAARMSELATDKGMAAFHKAGGGDGGFSKFAQITGIDTYGSILTPSTKAEIRSLVERGNTTEAFVQVARLHLDGAVFNYLRPNAPQYNQVWYGRLFGQYGTWPANAIGSLHDLFTAPQRHHSGATATLRSVQIAAKYALAAEAVYAAGYYLGVDTSSWIPFVHNTLAYDGGPAVSVLQDVEKFWQGDDRALGALKDDPGTFLAGVAARNIPFPASDVVRRATSQIAGEGLDDPARRLLGLRAQMDTQQDRWKVALGFNPFNRPPAKHLNLLERWAIPYPAAVQDQIHAAVPALPPGSAE